MSGGYLSHWRGYLLCLLLLVLEGLAFAFSSYFCAADATVLGVFCFWCDLVAIEIFFF